MSELDEIFPSESRLTKIERAVVDLFKIKVSEAMTDPENTEGFVASAELRQLGAELGLSDHRIISAYDLARHSVIEAYHQLAHDITQFEQGGA